MRPDCRKYEHKRLGLPWDEPEEEDEDEEEEVEAGEEEGGEDEGSTDQPELEDCDKDDEPDDEEEHVRVSPRKGKETQVIQGVANRSSSLKSKSSGYRER